MVVSSGMQSMDTMRRVYQTVKKHNSNFAILQCTSAYPLEAEDVNLRVIAVKMTEHLTIKAILHHNYTVIRLAQQRRGHPLFRKHP